MPIVLVRLSFLGIVLILLSTSCGSLPLPGAERDDSDLDAFTLYVVAPCGVAPKVDGAEAILVPNGELVVICETDPEPPSDSGLPAVLHYVDYVDPAKRVGTKAMVESAVAPLGGEGHRVVVFQTYCADLLEVGGWNNRPFDNIDLARLTVEC